MSQSFRFRMPPVGGNALKAPFPSPSPPWDQTRPVYAPWAMIGDLSKHLDRYEANNAVHAVVRIASMRPRMHRRWSWTVYDGQTRVDAIPFVDQRVKVKGGHWPAWFSTTSFVDVPTYAGNPVLTGSL